MEKGTLYQLRNLLDRRNVSKHPKSNVNAAEDFLEAVVIGHILTAVMSHLGMASSNDRPSSSLISHDLWMEDDTERGRILSAISASIVEKYVDLATAFKTQPQKSKEKSEGTVYDYACEVISLALLYLDMKDSVREGDGDRIILVWKYLMLLYRASGRKNYAIEALTLLTQYHITLAPNLAEQVKWSRFVNATGLPGHNISCDLHNEHLNRTVKTAIEGLGSNKSKTGITRAGKAIGVLKEVTESYDKEAGVTVPSGKHSRKSMEKDIALITQQLMECDVFDPETKATHNSFLHLKTNLIKTLDESALKEWMVERFSLSLHPLPIIIESDDEDSDS